MKLIKALTLSLGRLDTPVITPYQCGVILFLLFEDKKFQGEEITDLERKTPNRKIYDAQIEYLVDEGVLVPYKGLKSTVFSLVGRSPESIEDIVCTIDPFCYVTHLSAMAYHGLTDRIPSTLFISSPPANKWREFAKERMQRDLKTSLPTYIDNKMPLLVHELLDRVEGHAVHRFSSIHLGAYKIIRGRQMRVSTIGRTFLDMIRHPELCGGLQHVLAVYEEYGERYLRLIVDEVDRKGAPVDKVRAGYILEERMGLQHDVVNSWKAFAQRGGSRKLDASAEYIAEWSDDWKISLNTFE